MKKVEAYRVEIPIVAEDEYSKEIDKASKDIKDLERKIDKSTKAQDDFTKSSKDAAKAQDQVSKSTDKASKSVEGVGKSAQQAERQVGRTSKVFESFGSKVKSLQRAKANIEVAVKDRATRVLKGIRGTWEGFRRDPVVRLTVFAIDKAFGVLRGIRRMATSIPTMITIGLSYVGVKNLSEATVGAAMNWEQYEVSMTHWLDGNIKQAKELTKWMGEFADSTPYSSPELFPALTRAVSITDRDLDKSKRLLRIASDMAALTPERSVEDAMQAIANARMGNTMMLEGFGLDISKAEMDAMGGWDELVNTLDKRFKGGAEKLSKTAAGVIATLKGYRSSFMRSIGTGFLEPMKPRLDAISEWLENNQETWGRWKDVAMGHGEDLSESIFSTLEKGFNHVRTNYLDNPDFMDLDLRGKISFVADDIGGYLNKEVKPAMVAWWDETGSGVAVEIGKLIGEGVVEGIKIGLKGGTSLFTGAWSDLFDNIKEDPFSKETGSSALMAGAATLGAGYLGKKLIYNPGKAVYGGGKKAKGWFDGRSERKQQRQDKRTASRERREARRAERAERSAARKSERASKKTQRTTRIPKGSNKLLRRVPLIGAGLTAMSLVGASQEEVPGLVGGLAGGWGGAKLGAMGGAALGSVVPGIGTAIGGIGGGILGGIGGAIGGEKLMSWIFGPKKTEASTLDSGYSSMPLLDGGSSIGESFTLDFDTSILQRNIDNLAMHFGEASGHVVGAFHPLEGSTTVTSHNIEALNTHLGEASSWVVESFFPMTEASGSIAQNISALSTNLAEASVYTVEAFYPLSGEGALMSQNISALSMNLAEASVHAAEAFYPLSVEGPVMGQNVSALAENLAESSVYVMESFYPLTESGAVMNQNVTALSTNLAESSVYTVEAFYPLTAAGPALIANMSTLSGRLAMASGWVNSLNGIQNGAEAVKSALGNLASRIRQVPTPTMPAATGGFGSITPYARGGIATSPHIGLVAEAGVPEAMIPWDGSSRSKALWQQTGEALGMFDGGSTSGGSSDVGGMAAIAAGDTNFNFGDISVSGGVDMSAEEIFNKLAPVLYEKIKAALAKRR